MSVSAPCPLTIRPSLDTRTVTSPCESVPLVMLLTEYSSRSVPVCRRLSIALNEASTGPPPVAVALCSTPSTARVTCAFGISPVSEQTRRYRNFTRSFSAVRLASVTSACKSSS